MAARLSVQGLRRSVCASRRARRECWLEDDYCCWAARPTHCAAYAAACSALPMVGWSLAHLQPAHHRATTYHFCTPDCPVSLHSRSTTQFQVHGRACIMHAFSRKLNDGLAGNALPDDLGIAWQRTGEKGPSKCISGGGWGVRKSRWPFSAGARPGAGDMNPMCAGVANGG